MLMASLIDSNTIWKTGLWAYLWGTIFTTLMDAIIPSLIMSEMIFWAADPGTHRWRNGTEQEYGSCFWLEM